MKAEDFKISHCPSGKTHYLHIENGKKREQILNAMQNGTITPEEFKSEQKKMRGGKYLKYLFSETEYLKAIKTT